MPTATGRNIPEHMHFRKKLKKVLRETGSNLIVGLDTDISGIPSSFQRYSNPQLEFNRAVIEATKMFVAGYKLNTAFYERYGVNGWQALTDTVKIIPEDLITIADAKRSDLENTAEQYAKAFFDLMNYDSITLSPYMGEDSVRPFLRRKNKFVWILLLTSNYGSRDFQFLNIQKKPLWEHIAEKTVKWNDQKTGFVVGANHTKEIKYICGKYPQQPLLIPGIGAQKNSLSELMKSLTHNLFLINSSRSVLYPCSPKLPTDEYLSNVSSAAEKLRAEINGFKIRKAKDD